jgi:hypothetical protein
MKETLPRRHRARIRETVRIADHHRRQPGTAIRCLTRHRVRRRLNRPLRHRRRLQKTPARLEDQHRSSRQSIGANSKAAAIGGITSIATIEMIAAIAVKAISSTGTDDVTAAIVVVVVAAATKCRRRPHRL